MKLKQNSYSFTTVFKLFCFSFISFADSVRHLDFSVYNASPLGRLDLESCLLL